MKDKKGITITNAFQTILHKSGCKPSKIWVDKDSEFSYRSIKLLLQDNDIEMYSTHNERKSVVAERFIKTLKNKIFKYMNSIFKSVYIDKLDDILNKCNHIYHSTTKMKPVDLKIDTNLDFEKKNNKDSKFKVGDHVRISKYIKHFCKRLCSRLV